MAAKRTTDGLAGPAVGRLGGEPVLPVGPVRVYVCGITPYAVTHLGHASTFVWTDLAARVLRGAGHQVQLARNVTDVDEALFAAALRQGRPYDELAALARFSFDRTMTALRVRVPEHEPVARRQVDRVVQLATALLVRGAGRAGRGDRDEAVAGVRRHPAGPG